MGINLKALADNSMGMEGRDLNNGEFIVLNIPYAAGAATTISGPVLSRSVQVQAIMGMVDTASTNAATASVYKASSGSAVGAGTLLHTGSFNAQGAANTNQTLVVSAANAQIAAGQRVGIVFNTAPGAAGAGVITVLATPV